MDLEWENLRDDDRLRTELPPSELFRRQIIATFEEEPMALQLIPLLGADRCMWASDYPHTDSTFPESQQRDRGDAGRAARPRPPQDHRPQLRHAVRVRVCRLTGDRAGTVLGFDHVALPMEHTEAMVGVLPARSVWRSSRIAIWCRCTSAIR